MNSLTITPQAPASGRRQGRSRACSSNQSMTGECSGSPGACSDVDSVVPPCGGFVGAVMALRSCHAGPRLRAHRHGGDRATPYHAPWAGRVNGGTPGPGVARSGKSGADRAVSGMMIRKSCRSERRVGPVNAPISRMVCAVGSLRNPVGPLPSSIYWRRRAVLLSVLALSALLITWGVTAGGGGGHGHENGANGKNPAPSITPGPSSSGPAISQAPGGRDETGDENSGGASSGTGDDGANGDPGDGGSADGGAGGGAGGDAGSGTSAGVGAGDALPAGTGSGLPDC